MATFLALFFAPVSRSLQLTRRVWSARIAGRTRALRHGGEPSSDEKSSRGESHLFTALGTIAGKGCERKTKRDRVDASEERRNYVERYVQCQQRFQLHWPRHRHLHWYGSLVHRRCWSLHRRNVTKFGFFFTRARHFYSIFSQDNKTIFFSESFHFFFNWKNNQ